MEYYSDTHITLYNSDCRDMSELPDGSVQCVVTSPPFWGLRKYSGNQELIWGGDPNCKHEWLDATYKRRSSDGMPGFSKERYDDKTYEELRRDKPIENAFCSKCSAWRGAFGLEPQPEMYIEHTIEILREIRRVLRKDGVVFWDIGDSYASNGIYIGKYKETHPEHIDFHTKHSGRYPQKQKGYRGGSIKAKDLCLIPFKVAIAAQEDGWWVRSVIIWSKSNPMPESVTDRPTESHEYILMLTKNKNYYWDADAVRTKFADATLSRVLYPTGLSGKVAQQIEKNIGGHPPQGQDYKHLLETGGANLKTVWTFPTKGFPESHFAVFPEKLPEICIRASTKVGDLVLDPFAGSGTTLAVAKREGRRAAGYELSEEYCKLAKNRVMSITPPMVGL